MEIAMNILKCKVHGCEENVFSNGYCKRHNQQIYRHGKITKVEKPNPLNTKTECIVDGCYDKPHGRFEYCKRHYSQIQRNGKVISVEKLSYGKKKKKCSVGWCNELTHGESKYCQRHYAQVRRKGHILDIKRKCTEPNKINYYDDYLGVLTYKKDGTVRAEYIVDYQDLHLIKNYKWYSSGYPGYLYTNDNGKSISFQRMLFPNAQMVDHINGNILDNTRRNLRPCAPHQNSANRNKNAKNTSGRLGVNWSTAAGKWHPQISVKGKRIHLGHFDDLQDAIKAREQAEQKYFGEFAPRER